MAILKQIKFGTSTTPIAKTVVKGTGVVSVTDTEGFSNNETEEKDYSYDIDVNVDGSTIVKSGNSLAVGNVPAAKVSVADEAGVFTAENVETALKELKDDIASTGSAAKTYKIVEVATEEAANTSLKEYKVQVAVGSGDFADDAASAKIVVPKDQHLKNVELVTEDNEQHTGQFLKYTYVLNTGAESDVYVDVSSFLTQSEFGNGLEVSSAGVVSVKIDPASEGFLTVGADGVKLAGVQNAINNAVAGLDVTDAAVEGQYVSQVSETDGKIAVSRLNVSDAKLNGYVKGEKPTSTIITAADDVKGAIAKLEHQVDAAKAAATTKVAKDNAASHLTLDSSTAADGSTTYTIGESDIASKTALDAEIKARKDVDGQSGDAYVANGKSNYISGASSLNDADVKLDAALKAEETRAKSAETSIDSVVGLTKATDGETRTYTNEGNYIGKAQTKTVASDIKALDTQLKKVTDDLAKVQYKVSGTTLEFFGISEKTA